MTGRHARAIWCGTACGMALAATVVVAAQAVAPAKPAEKNPYVKLAAPWPDADTLRKRQVDAERRALFASHEPLAFTLTADFRAIDKDRDPQSTRRFPGVLTLATQGAAPIAVQLGTRGNSRLNVRTCDFPPLRVDFPKQDGKSAVKGTVFAGQETLKLVTHYWASSTFDQYLLREYLVYRIFNVMTPRSFRARQAVVTYVDSTNGKRIEARPGIFIEEDGDLARRMGGRVVDLLRSQARDLDPDAATTMAILQYMVGNTDYSIYALHNMKLVQTPALGRLLIPVPYDFDMTGLVNPYYAGVDKRLAIATVRDRLYRGPCRTMEELEPLLAVFRARQPDVLALVDALPGLRGGDRRDVRTFLNEFYETLARPGRVKRAFIDGCRSVPTM